MVILAKHQIKTLQQGGEEAAIMAQEIQGNMEAQGMDGHDVYIEIYKQTKITADEWLTLLKYPQPYFPEVKQSDKI